MDSTSSWYSRSVVVLALADGPADSRSYRLGPPAVEDREVEPAVAAGLHAAGAAGLHGAARGVQPDVHALHQVAGHAHVVVLEEDDAAAQTGRSRAKCTIWRMSSLPAWSCGWALPAKMICTGRSRVGQDALQPLRVAEEQGGPLVGGEAPGEADGQGLGIRAPRRRRQSRRAMRRAARSCCRSCCAGEGHQPLAPPLVGPPQLLVGDVVHALPDLGVARESRASAGRGSGRTGRPCRGRSRTGVWMPLVMAVMGISSAGTLGPDAAATSCGRPRRAACSRRWRSAARRRASTVMQNGSLRVCGLLAAQAEELLAVEAELAASSCRSTCRSGRRRTRRCRPARACGW